jgi:hypothetical protein
MRRRSALLNRATSIGSAIALSAACVAAHAQLPEPSSVPATLGRQIHYRALPKAWLRLAVRFAPIGRTHGNGCATSIELSAVSDRERLIAAKRFSTPEELAAMLTNGTIEFEGVPTIQPLWLRFTIRAKDGAVVGTHARSYRLHLPDEAAMVLLGPSRALDESGYLGDFVIDHARGDVVRTDNGG